MGEIDDYQTSEMEFGKKVALALENQTGTGDLVTDMVIAKIPKCPLREYNLTEKFISPHGEIMLLGKLDSFDEENLIVREYKTGKVKWTIDRCKNSIQLRHYASLVWLKYGRLPNELWLDYAETQGKGDNICFTGNVINIKVDFKMIEILSYLSVVSRVAKEIDQLYRQYLNGKF